MVTNDYYKRGIYVTGTSATTDSSTCSTRQGSYIPTRPTTALEYELSTLQREHRALQAEHRALEFSVNEFKSCNSVLQNTIKTLKNKQNLFLEAISFHANIDEVKSTIKKLVTSRKNKLEFENLLDAEVDYLFKHKKNSK